jgi:hypothetical protein
MIEGAANETGTLPYKLKVEVGKVFEFFENFEDFESF